MAKRQSISVIIPVQNGADCLPRAVESALAQTYAPKEILIIEDNSTDDTLAVARQLEAAHESVHVYAVETEGVSPARNMGLRQATGELITFLDADDTMRPTMLEVLVMLMNETKADIAGCDFRDGDGTIHTYEGKEIITKAILADHDTRIWSKLFTRAAIGNATFEEDMTIGEDMLFLLSMATQQHLTYAMTEENLYSYTINPVGAMERPFTLSYMDQIRCWDRVEEILRAHDKAVMERDPRAIDEEGILSTEQFLRLRAIQIVSAVLVGYKIALLPRAQRREYETQWQSARASLRRYREDAGSRKYLPEGYPLKAELMDNYPRLFLFVLSSRPRT